MKSWAKKKLSQLNQKAPRELPEIQQEYQQLLTQAANAQYLVFVHGREVDRLNQRMLEVNQEAALRNKLDAETKAAEEAKKAKESAKEEK